MRKDEEDIEIEKNFGNDIDRNNLIKERIENRNEIENEYEAANRKEKERIEKEKEEQSEWTKPIEKKKEVSLLSKLGSVIKQEIGDLYRKKPMVKKRPSGIAIRKISAKQPKPKIKTVYINKPIKQSKPVSKLDIPMRRGAVYDSGIYTTQRGKPNTQQQKYPTASYDSGMYTINRSKKSTNHYGNSAIGVLFGNTKGTKKQSLDILSGNMSAISTLSGLHYQKPKKRV